MDGGAFVAELEARRDARLRELSAAGRDAVRETHEEDDPERLLEIALANEINVSELAAFCAARCPEVDSKPALARAAERPGTRSFPGC